MQEAVVADGDLQRQALAQGHELAKVLPASVEDPG
jgi:hypothetical protein